MFDRGPEKISREGRLGAYSWKIQRSSQVRTGQVGTGQVGTGQVGTGQVGTGQVKTG